MFAKKPGKFLLKLRDRLPPPAIRFARRFFARLRRERDVPFSEADYFSLLDRSLWSGFQTYGLAELEKRKLDAPAGAMRRAAALKIARRALHDRDLTRAIDNIRIAKGAPFSEMLAFSLLEAEILRQSGRREEALGVAEAALDKHGADPQISILISSIYGSWPDRTSERLDRINLTLRGFAPIALEDPAKPLSIRNLTSTAPSDPLTGTAKLTVIMPAYNAADMIDVSVGSILKQTWSNLELVIVDDASTDNTWDIIQSLAATDKRIVPVRHSTNRGAYFARDTGLELASGDFITVNDADDWCHPEKFSIQMRAALDAPDTINTTYGVRVTEDLEAILQPRHSLIFSETYSSLLVKAEHIRKLGGWYRAQMASDSELYQRLLKYLGRPAKRLHPRVPLTLILASANSLTRASLTGLSSLGYGARREYLEASAYWRENATDLTIDPDTKPFPVPRICLSRSKDLIELDVLLVSDFSEGAKYDLEMLRDAVNSGAKFAVLHIPCTENHGIDADESIRKLIHEHRLQVVVPGERVKPRTVIVNRPRALSVLPDARVSIDADDVVVIAHKFAKAGSPQAFDPRLILENAKALFNADAKFQPASRHVREALLDQAAAHDLTQDNGRTLADVLAATRKQSTPATP
jgi:hypothetical protein